MYLGGANIYFEKSGYILKMKSAVWKVALLRQRVSKRTEKEPKKEKKSYREENA